MDTWASDIDRAGSRQVSKAGNVVICDVGAVTAFEEDIIKVTRGQPDIAVAQMGCQCGRVYSSRYALMADLHLVYGHVPLARRDP